jgi:hypothetical protein
MLYRVSWQIVTDVSKQHSTFGQFNGIFNPSDEGTTLLRYIGNYSPIDAACHSRRLESSSTPLLEPQVLRLFFVQSKINARDVFEVLRPHLVSYKPTVKVLLIVYSHLQIALFPWCFPTRVFYGCGATSCVLHILPISFPWCNWHGNSGWRIQSFTYINLITISLEFRSEGVQRV